MTQTYERKNNIKLSEKHEAFPLFLYAISKRYALCIYFTHCDCVWETRGLFLNESSSPYEYVLSISLEKDPLNDNGTSADWVLLDTAAEQPDPLDNWIQDKVEPRIKANHLIRYKYMIYDCPNKISTKTPNMLTWGKSRSLARPLIRDRDYPAILLL